MDEAFHAAHTDICGVRGHVKAEWGTVNIGPPKYLTTDVIDSCMNNLTMTNSSILYFSM
jgi:hypothetical protein